MISSADKVLCAFVSILSSLLIAMSGLILFGLLAALLFSMLWSIHPIAAIFICLTGIAMSKRLQ
jgi:hypothetical protein